MRAAPPIALLQRLPLVPALLLLLLLTAACASAPPAAVVRHPTTERLQSAERSRLVHAASELVGAPYRRGGASPTGFDCSGLVVYSYQRAGIGGLPHSAAGLEALARPIPVERIEPGDLLFFRLDDPSKTGHVAIYVGDGEFVHAPSSGKRVERVSFDHVYWGRRIRRAGRLLP